MKYLFILFLLSLVGCQTTPGDNVRLSEDKPSDECQEIGQVIGTSNSRHDAREKSMADLRHEASLKSANYVQVLAVSAHGGSVRGMAYRCN